MYWPTHSSPTIILFICLVASYGPSVHGSRLEPRMLTAASTDGSESASKLRRGQTLSNTRGDCIAANDLAISSPHQDSFSIGPFSPSAHLPPRHSHCPDQHSLYLTPHPDPVATPGKEALEPKLTRVRFFFISIKL